jgi:hypothetical protein
VDEASVEEAVIVDAADGKVLGVVVAGALLRLGSMMSVTAIPSMTSRAATASNTPALLRDGGAFEAALRIVARARARLAAAARVLPSVSL